MSDLKFEIDIDEIAGKVERVTKQLEEDLIKGVSDLSMMTHARISDKAKDKLKSTRELYRENLLLPERIDTGSGIVWVITLKEPAVWIEKGVSPGFMGGLLNGKSSKTSKDGKKYAIIPFKHNKPPTRQTTSARELAQEVQQTMKKKKIPWAKIEKGPDGSPREGRLHSFDVKTARKGNESGTSLGAGVSVYQKYHNVDIKDKKGNVTGTKEVMRKDVVAFRIITEDHEQQGKWKHPGRDPSDFMGEALKWAERYWETDILPSILKKYEQQ